VKGLKYCLIFIAVILYSGCEKKYSWEFQSENFNKLIVDGIITSELKAQCIKLSISNPGMNMSYRPYPGANIEVSDGTNQYEFIESVF